MRVIIETVRDAVNAAEALKGMLNEDGIRRGHAVNCCSCGVCHSRRLMETVVTNLEPLLDREKP